MTALGRKTFSENALVAVGLSGGAEGWGEASSSIAMASQTAPGMAACLKRLNARFHGRDARDVSGWIAEAWRAEPQWPTAVAAFETAVWDALARAEGIPFYRLWGPRARSLRTLLTLPVAPPDEVYGLARGAFKKGFHSLKLKINGREPLAVDRARLRQAHRAAPKARWLLDANQSHRPESLLELLHHARRDGVPVQVVEEPFLKHDWKALKVFKRRSPQAPLILDESIQNPSDARRAVAGALAQGVNVKLAKCGLKRGKEIVQVFEKMRKPRLMIGCMAESKLGLSASVHFAMGLGCFHEVDLDSDLLLAQRPPAGGYIRRGPVITLPKNPKPGLGMEGNF